VTKGIFKHKCHYHQLHWLIPTCIQKSKRCKYTQHTLLASIRTCTFGQDPLTPHARTQILSQAVSCIETALPTLMSPHAELPRTPTLRFNPRQLLSPTRRPFQDTRH
jgi:hypothetical protein